MAKAEVKVIERIYNVPLRKEYMKVARWKKTQKAMIALRQFLQKHMKTKEVKLSKALNEKVWNHGIRNPPHHVKVIVTKNAEGIVEADLFGAKKESKPESKKNNKTNDKKTKEEVDNKKAKLTETKESKKETKTEMEKPVSLVEKSPKQHDEKATEATSKTEKQQD